MSWPAGSQRVRGWEHARWVNPQWRTPKSALSFAGVGNSHSLQKSPSKCMQLRGRAGRWSHPRLLTEDRLPGVFWLFRGALGEAERIAVVVREESVHAHDFERVVEVGGAHVADGAGVR
jgi:hypothetical protein